MNVMKINPKPNWRPIPGYAFGMRQSCMTAIEYFPSDPSVYLINKEFSILINEITGNNNANYSYENISAPVAVAKLISSAARSIQDWMKIPIVESGLVNLLNNSSEVNIILPWWDLEASKIAYSLCVDIWNEIYESKRSKNIVDLQSYINNKMSLFVSQSANEYAQVKAVVDLDINLIRQPGGILCLGTGIHSRWMNSTSTDRTSSLSFKIARNKYQTALMLRQAGLPAAENMLVSSEDETLARAHEIGLPVVVKPANLDRGEGVSADLFTDEQIRKAFAKANACSSLVMVEKMIPGFTHRFTVVGEKVVSLRQRIPGGVTGDGKRTISELVSDSNKSEWAKRWKRLHGRELLILDDEAIDILSHLNLSPNSILEEGCFQRLRRRDNINDGGSNRDISLSGSDVHSDNIDLAVSAAKIMRLDIAGIDFISPDISKSWRDVDSGICEVNARPQFSVRHTPELFREIIWGVLGKDPHIPADLIVCADDAIERTLVVETLSKKFIGWTISTKEGLYRDGQSFTRSFPNGFEAACAVMTRGDTKGAICIMSVIDLLGAGSPVKKWRHMKVLKNNMTDLEISRLSTVQKILKSKSQTEF